MTSIIQYFQQQSIRLYFYTNEQNARLVGQPWYELSQCRPQLSQHWKELRDQKLSVSLIKCKGYSFMEMSFHQLYQSMRDVVASQRNLCTIVLEKHPCHLFFDLDGKTDDIQHPSKAALCRAVINDLSAVQDAFMALFSDFFLKIFLRKPNLSHVYWETATTTTKLSLHLHIVSEACVDIVNHKNLVKRFISYVEEKYLVNEKTKQLCSQGNDDKFVHLIDFSIYTNNRNMRLVGCCKPGGQPLVHLPNSKDSGGVQPSPEEILFASLPSWSYCGAPGQKHLRCDLPVVHTKSETQKRRRREDDDESGRNMNILDFCIRRSAVKIARV